MKDNCEQILTFHELAVEFIKRHKTLFVLYAIFVLIIPLQDVGLPHFFGKLIKALQTNTDLSPPLISIICIIAVLQLGYICTDYINIRLFPEMQKFIREEIMRHLFEMQQNNYSELHMGEVTSKLIKIPTYIYSVFNQIKLTYIPVCLVFIVAVIYFILQDKVIGISLLAVLLTLLCGVILLIRNCENVSMQRDREFNKINEEVDDVMRNAMTVLNYEQQDNEIARINEMHKQYKYFSEESLTCVIKLRLISIPIIIGYFTWFTLYLYRKMKANRQNAGMFVSMFIIMLQVTNMMWKTIASMKEFVLSWGIIQEGMRIFTICHHTKSQDLSATLKDGILISNVSYMYDKAYALHNISLHIPQGQTVLVVGKIGSGKSTLLKLLMKYLEPTHGNIFLNTVSYSNISSEDLRKRVGYIPQNPILFNRTIYENITYGFDRTEWTREKVLDLIRKIEVDEIVKKAIMRMDEDVGKYGSKLSGGQRQIIWILRTIIQNPEIVIMDEPTSAIDESTKEIVQKLLSYLMTKKTVIMVTHDMYLEKFSDRVIEIEDGRIIQDFMV